MKALFHLGHPAHFHLFKNLILFLQSRGDKAEIVIKKKDILENLVSDAGFKYHNILPDGRKDSKFGIISGLLKQDMRLLMFCLKSRPDVLIGSTPAVAHVGTLLGIPSVNLSEDDASEVMLYAKITYPFSKYILSPIPCNNGKWDVRTIKYPSYHELAYLHPNHFKPDIEVVRKYISTDTPFYVLRFSSLNAYHDTGVSGINKDIAIKIVKKLTKRGQVLITSEKKLAPELEQYRMPIKPLDMHHFLSFAELYIGDSQTMAAEAAVLGTPFIRVNDFVGKLGYLNELENEFELGYGIRPVEVGSIFDRIDSILNNQHLQADWEVKRQNMLSIKIDFSEYLNNFIQKFDKNKVHVN